jgi:hypothetical protein
MRVSIPGLMSPREERAIRNEELFREVNAHIADLEERSRDVYFEEPLPLVCECSRTGCAAPIEVAPATFRRVRGHPLQFLVAVGHEELEVETIVESGSGYLVVEKHRP